MKRSHILAAAILTLGFALIVGWMLVEAFS